MYLESQDSDWILLGRGAECKVLLKLVSSWMHGWWIWSHFEAHDIRELGKGKGGEDDTDDTDINEG